jgi:uncharacterized protein YxeA
MTSSNAPFLTTLFLAGSLLISSCSNSETESIPVHHKNSKNQDEKDDVLTYAFNEGIHIGNIQFVMYPLTLAASKNTGREGIKSYYSGSSSGPYWNIAFYDYKTADSYLLDSGHVMRINSFQQMKDLLVYSVTFTDYNGDGQLDHKDPTCLFTSNLGGRNFKQITPNGRHVQNFQLIPKSTSVLIQAMADTNGDKKFGGSDEIIPMIFDSEKADTAKDTFTAAFKAGINQKFKKLY